MEKEALEIGHPEMQAVSALRHRLTYFLGQGIGGAFEKGLNLAVCSCFLLHFVLQLVGRGFKGLREEHASTQPR